MEPKSENFKQNVEYIINLQKGWGSSRQKLTFDMPLKLLILPCSWFDPDWIKPESEKKWDSFLKTHIQKLIKIIFILVALLITGTIDGIINQRKNSPIYTAVSSNEERIQRIQLMIEKFRNNSLSLLLFLTPILIIDHFLTIQKKINNHFIIFVFNNFCAYYFEIKCIEST